MDGYLIGDFVNIQSTCEICKQAAQQRLRVSTHDEASSSSDELVLTFSCNTCGDYELTEISKVWLNDPKKGEVRCNRLSNYLYRQKNKSTVIDIDLLKKIDELLPKTISEISDNIILYLSTCPIGTQLYSDSYSLWITITGSDSKSSILFVIQELYKRNLLTGNPSKTSFSLSYDGWLYADELKKGRSDKLKAFMAMPFKVVSVDQAFEHCFKPACQLAGFELNRVSDTHRTGLIDEHIMVDIRSARFVIADLTNGNLGAYWEAGFAEGLGKKVIYTCEQSFFDEHKAHFDVAHRVIVTWDLTNLEPAIDRIKSTIRNEFWEDAIQEDPVES